jgi:transcriptional regulator with XRE-family HTH domain
MDVAGLRHIFSSRIRKLREGKMNQGEFADSVGISRGAMSYYEQELRTPDIGVLRAICEKYDIPADYLLGLMPDLDNTVSDVCLETGLYPKAVKRLQLIEKFKAYGMDVVESAVEELGVDREEAIKLTAFNAAQSMVNLFLSTDEGLEILTLLSAIIFGAELYTGSDEQPVFRFMQSHKYMQVEYPLKNITAALWINVQENAAELRQKISDANPQITEAYREYS